MNRGQLAARTDCNLETVRYYEKIGLLREPPRSANNYRVYDETHLGRLR
ncbi:MerR family DNA-binding transcriptional regulator, partial [Brevundimonas sp.]